MTDKEMMELAAKAAGRLLPHGNPALTRPNEELRSDGGNYWFWPAGDSWNPLTDDGDALRLVVKLRLTVGDENQSVRSMAFAQHPDKSRCYEPSQNDPYAATRRAIVRAAASIGASL